MHSHYVLIACASPHFARDIQRKLLVYNSFNVIVSQTEDELKSHIKNHSPFLVFIEECFRMNITAYLIGRIHDKYPKLRFAVFSYTEIDPDRLAVFLNSGAASFINFRLEVEEYMKGIKIVLSGDNYIPEDMRDKIKKTKVTPLDKVTLTKREIEIMGLLVDGVRLCKAAEILGISKGTVKLHKKHAYAKCGVHSLIELAKFVYDTKRLKAAF